MKIYKALILCSMLTLFGYSSKAQVLEGIQSNFKQYNDNVLQEKMYVHTDKSFYLTGEILWFKVYNVDAGLNIPLDVSKVAYVEILDEANSPVLQAKIALKTGTGTGSFYIPVTFKNGNYKLRAYTSWMKNFSADKYFEKNISIVNPLNEIDAEAKTAKAAFNIGFFPEGGNLVNGVPNTVGFKIAGTDGKGVDLGGVIINQRNDTVVRFQSLKFGMGSFAFTPDANNTYKAVIRLGRDNALINDLPVINTSGYGLHLSNDNGQPAITISTRGQAAGGPLYLVVNSGHQITMAQNITVGGDGNVTVPLSADKLGKGINHITLFNSAKQPVCERMYFNRPTDLLTVRSISQREYKTRSAVALNVSANDAAGKPLAANMSVAVYKLDSLNTNEDADIVSSLWLGTDVKGNIESPGYYFGVLTTETDKALDNLLLTQGWSRFKWADVLNPLPKFTYLPEYSGHLVTGKITDAAGTPTPDLLAYMGVIGKRTQLYGSVSDASGHLMFNTKQLYGPGEIVLQTNTEKDSTSRISIANPYSEQYSTSTLPALQLPNQLQSELQKSSINMQVQNIYSSSKLKQYYNPLVDSGSFYADNYKLYKLDDFTRFTTMEEVLREYVAEITIARRQGRLHINVLSTNGFLSEGDPLVMLDGVPVFNMDKLFSIDPLKIQRLDMVNQVYYWGPIFADGIMNIRSYKGDMGGFEINPHAVVLDYEGMQLQREFYSPVYKTSDQQKSRTPDFRNTLYWSPEVNTDASGKAVVTFYTADKPGKYIAVFQGLTAQGQAGSYSSTFEVVK